MYCVKCGKGIVNKILSAVGEMHLPAAQGEYVQDGSFNNLQKYSYCGPGTKYEQRNREGYKGINELDKMCKLHDQFYTNNLDTASRNISDEALAHRAYEIANSSQYDTTQRNMANLVYHIMKNKARFGLGISVGPFETLANELHKPVRRKFKRRKVQVYGIDDIWGADLVEMQEWSGSNKGYKYILTVIDVYSKYAWAVPLKDKKGETVTESFKFIVNNSKRKPRHIWCDQGKEFYNKHMDKWLQDNGINRYSTYSENKSVVIERFNRTVKEKMWKKFTAENTRNWIDMLDKLLKEYNNSFHRTIGMTPAECSKLESITMKSYKEICKKPKFKVGDKLRLSRLKGTFEAGYLPNFSEALYVVNTVKNTCPVTYILEDMKGDLLAGSFYEQELLKTKQEIYRIEKVLKKKYVKGVEHALVKWMGYSDKFNEWIPTANLNVV